MGLDMIATSVVLSLFFLLPVASIAYYLFKQKDYSNGKKPLLRPFNGPSNGFMKGYNHDTNFYVVEG